MISFLVYGFGGYDTSNATMMQISIISEYSIDWYVGDFLFNFIPINMGIIDLSTINKSGVLLILS